MYSVYVAAQPSVLNYLSTLLLEDETLILMGQTSDLTEAIKACRADPPGVLILDDTLLDPEAPHLTPLNVPVIMVSHQFSPDTARRALALRCKDYLPQSAWQRELLPTLSRVAVPLYHRDKKDGRTVAIFSSKGGVGKTTLSVNLAVALANRTREPVLIIDLDLSFGDVASMMGIQPTRTIYDLRAAALDQSIVDTLVWPQKNVAILSAPISPVQAEDIDAPLFVSILEAVKPHFSWVVLDLSPGYGGINITALDISDRILTVCTPDVVTLRTVGQALSLFREQFRYPAEKIRLVLNRTGSNTGIERSDITAILKTSNLYDLPSAGSDPVRAANEGVPYILRNPNTALSRSIVLIADDLVDKPQTTRRRLRWPRTNR